MSEIALFPIADAAGWLLPYSKLPLHTGEGKVDRHGDPDDPIARMAHLARQADREPAEPEFEASFFVPPSGNWLVLLRWSGEARLNRNFGEGLTVIGDSPEG